LTSRYDEYVFMARYPGDCGYCGEDIKGRECTYVPDEDKVVVHKECLIPHVTGVDPIAVTAHRNEKQCQDCFLVHAGDCL
jgi:hypothetical protein